MILKRSSSSIEMDVMDCVELGFLIYKIGLYIYKTRFWWCYLWD